MAADTAPPGPGRGLKSGTGSTGGSKVTNKKPKEPAKYYFHARRILDGLVLVGAFFILVLARLCRPGFWSTLMYTLVSLPAGVVLAFIYYSRKKGKADVRKLVRRAWPALARSRARPSTALFSSSSPCPSLAAVPLARHPCERSRHTARRSSRRAVQHGAGRQGHHGARAARPDLGHALALRARRGALARRTTLPRSARPHRLGRVRACTGSSTLQVSLLADPGRTGPPCARFEGMRRRCAMHKRVRGSAAAPRRRA